MLKDQSAEPRTGWGGKGPPAPAQGQLPRAKPRLDYPVSLLSVLAVILTMNMENIVVF